MARDRGSVRNLSALACAKPMLDLQAQQYHATPRKGAGLPIRLRNTITVSCWVCPPHAAHFIIISPLLAAR